MNIGIISIAANNGVSFEMLGLIILNCGILLLFAKSFKIGIILAFMLNALAFMVYHYFGLIYTYPLIIMFCWLVVGSLSLYLIPKQQGVGGLI